MNVFQRRTALVHPGWHLYHPSRAALFAFSRKKRKNPPPLSPWSQIVRGRRHAVIVVSSAFEGSYAYLHVPSSQARHLESDRARSERESSGGSAVPQSGGEATGARPAPHRTFTVWHGYCLIEVDDIILATLYIYPLSAPRQSRGRSFCDDRLLAKWLGS